MQSANDKKNNQLIFHQTNCSFKKLKGNVEIQERLIFWWIDKKIKN